MYDVFVSTGGKFAQNADLMKTMYVEDYDQLIKLLMDESVEVGNLIILSDSMMLVQYREKDPAPLSTENIVIAAYTTAHARLRLYETMEQLVACGHRKLAYFDTDSCLFVQRAGEYDPPTGPFLGDLVDEFPGRKIVNYASGGPKNYFYEFEDGGHVTKVKGISLTYKASKVITPNLIQRLVKNNDGEKVKVVTDKKIARDRPHGVISKPEEKRYRVVYTKRVIGEGGVTYPYGYRGVREEVPPRVGEKRKHGCDDATCSETLRAKRVCS